MADESMKVRPCPDCGGTVSLRAPSCPHCGAPLIVPSLPPHNKDDKEPGADMTHPAPSNGGRVRVFGRGEGLFMQTANLGCFVLLAILGIVLIVAVISVLLPRPEPPNPRARPSLEQGMVSREGERVSVAVTYWNDAGIERTADVACTAYDHRGEEIGRGAHSFARVPSDQRRRADIRFRVDSGSALERVRCRQREH